MVTISREYSNEVRTTLEDMVQYLCEQSIENGELVSGETTWKVISALAEAKLAQFAGDIV